jgi:hypothetical protein
MYLNFINVSTLFFRKNTPLFWEWSFVKVAKYFEPYTDGFGNGPTILMSINFNTFNVLYEYDLETFLDASDQQGNFCT